MLRPKQTIEITEELKLLLGQQAELLKHRFETLTEDELRTYCKGHLAHYKVPRYIRFVSEFPQTVTGKIQKFKIREQMIHDLGLDAAARREMA